MQIKKLNKLIEKSRKLKCFWSIKFYILIVLLFTSSTVINGQKTPPMFEEDGDNFTKLGTDTEYLELIEKYNAAEPANTAEAKQLRNKLIFETVLQLKASTSDYRKGKIKRNKLLQTIFDVLEIGAATAIAIMKGERAQTVTAHAITGFQAGRNSLNKNFKLLETEAVFNKLKALQADKLALVYERLDKDVVEFSWKDAKSMLRDYLDLDITDAVVAITTTATNEKNFAENRANNLKKLGISVGVTKAQYDLSAKNFATIRAIVEQFPDDAPAGAAPPAIAAVATKRDEVIAKLKGMYDLIVSIPKFNEILEAIPNEPGVTPAGRAKYLASLANLEANKYVDTKVNATDLDKEDALVDYERILLAFNKGVTARLPANPKLAEEVEQIIPNKN